MALDSTLTVLIADDSALVRERLADMIAELEGVELVGQAHDTDTALEAIRRLKPHVMILDIRMPGGSGIQVLEAAKQEMGPPVAIMLTAFAYAQYRRKCLEAGAEYFFDKSSEFECVAETLEGLQRELTGRVVDKTGRNCP
jgi:DNA-binding NarL/FixJ family response regulator